MGEVYLSVDRDELTGGIQISINDNNGGYRIAGPKYCGRSVTLKKHILTEGDVAEIRRYLRTVNQGARTGSPGNARAIGDESVGQ